MHIIIADDYCIIRLGMKYILQEWMRESSVHFAESIPELLKLLSSQRMDIIVLDSHIPGGNDFHTIRLIRAIQVDVKIIVFSGQDERVYALRYIDSGADGYLQKDSKIICIKDAFNTILRGQKYLSDNLKTHLLQNRLKGGAQLNGNVLENLTNRELEVCRLLIAGKRGVEIAQILFLHTSTVGTYKRKIFEKLGVRNVRELIDTANMYGFGIR